MGILFKKPEGTEGKAWPAILISGFVAFGGILFGYDTGTISGILAMPYWAQTFSTGYRDSTGQLNVTSSQSSAIVSILSAGTFFGALGAAPVGDIIGRRWGLIASNGVFVLGVVLQTIATSIPPFLAGRFFAGLGVGLISALVPLYQSETAPKWIRGFIVGSYQFSITIGLLLASVLNNATHHRNDSGSYRIPIAVQFAWSIILVGGMLILPETPRYLIKRDDTKAAALSLSKLRRLPQDHESIRQELSEIQANHQFEVSLGKSGYAECFRGSLLKRLLTGCGLQALQQLTGINFIFYYGTQFFKNSGFKNEFVITLITNCVNVGSTIPGLYAIDKWGRRPVLLTGAIGMAVSQLLVAVLGTTTTGQDAQGNIIVHNAAAQKAAIAFICLYIFFFAASWGPIAWVVTGEIFPLKTRAKSLSMTTATNWLLNWALSFATPYLVNYGDGNANLQSKIFFIWFGCCFLCIGFVYFMIYETKGLTLEEVDELYLEVKSARESVSWSPKGTFARVAEKGNGSAGILERTEKGDVGGHREIGAPDGVSV
uniref:Putative hexose transporter n=1 Tax=Emericella nidulans TaxID=162425 RepID=Q2WBH1_EMEND|nr:putative hexose transporter [Aspergillus nidulans]